MNLKTISAALDAAKAEVGNIQQKHAEATTRRDNLLAEVQGIDAAIEGAELAHAAALAAVELGEADSATDTAASLDAARAAESRKPELIQQRRTADAVIDGLTRRYADAHGRYIALTEQHRAAQVAYMEDRAQQAMDSARDAIAQVANAVAEAAAVRRVLESFGVRWTFGSIDIGEYHPIFRPDQNAVALMANALSNEIA